MGGAHRRDILKWSAASALGALAGFAAPLARARSRDAIVIPAAPQILTRTVTRELRDGASIVVERAWTIGFAPAAGGWRVGGCQSLVTVDAPAPLAELAEIERTRDASEAFPLLLDADGRIRRGAPPVLTLDMERVARAAESAIMARGTRPGEVQALRLFLGQLQQSASDLMSRFPDDLFFPSGETVDEAHKMEFPGGVAGEFRLRYAASADPATGLLLASERTVTTRVGDDSMNSLEHWSLQPA